MISFTIDSDNDFNDTVFGERSTTSHSYFQKQYEEFKTIASGLKTKWVEKTKRFFDDNFGENAIRRARNAVKRAGNLIKRDTIEPLPLLEDIQTAMPTMRRYVMANPMLRRAWIDQTVSGYDCDCPDNLKLVGAAHHDYRRVVDGVVREEVRIDGTTNCFVELCYHDDDERELITEEKLDVLYTWEVVDAYLTASQEDPTSIRGEKR